MTITPATLYWFTRLDGFNIVFATVSLVGVFVSAISIIVFIATSNSEYEDDIRTNKTFKSVLKWLIPTWLVCVLGVLFTPTSKEMAMIYVVPHLAESQVVKQDIPEVYDLGVKALKDWLKKETKEETKGE